MTNFKQFKLTPLRLKLETDYIYKIANDLNNIIINYAGDIFPHDKGAVANYLCLKVMRLVSRLNDFSLSDSLGENARRMLEIGMVQDELVKLGFSADTKIYINRFRLNRLKDIEISFWQDFCHIHYRNEFYYNSPTWQEDLISKVKELLNEKGARNES